MRIKTYFLIMILFLAFVLFANEYSPGAELGDAVFRSLSVYDPSGPGWCIIGHAALYRNSNSVGDWNSYTDIIDSDLNHSVIQATGEGTTVYWRTFQFFLNGFPKPLGWGYTFSNTPSTEQRKNLILHAMDQYGAAYPQKFNEWYYPKIMTPNSYPGSGDGCFRCDGLVEYAYEQEGMGFFSEEEKYHCWFRDSSGSWIGFPTFYPEGLRERMESEGPSKPILDIASPQNGDKIEIEVQIELTTDDGPNGSGIDRVEIYVDNKLKCPDDEDCDGEKTLSYTWNTEGVHAGLHRITIKSYDRAGNIKEKEILVYKGSAPWVIWTYPYNGKTDVSVDKEKTDVFIIFSKAMDRTTTEEAISISPNVPYHYIWNPDDEAITMEFDEDLDYCQEYIVTILDEAMSVDSIQFDGDGDGEPGGDYIFSFNTQPPPLTHEANPKNHSFYIPPPNGISGEVIIDGSSLKDTVTGTVSKTVFGVVDSIIFQGGEGNFTIPPGGNYEIPFSVFANGQGNIYVELELQSECLVTTYLASYLAINTESEEDMPGHDHPDDNLSPGGVAYSTGWIIEPDSVYGEAKIGIFLYGWTKGFGHFLGRYGISTIPVFSDLKYWKNPEENLWEVIDLLVIGSGALDGYNSPEFEQNLHNYIINGGNLLILTQKYGSDFSIIPGGIDGKGWNEDQSCSRNAVYLNKWHPVFSGQTRHWIDCHVDGYFTEYPWFADVLLKRRINGKPALISYNYGAGKVIITSAYSDWGYGHNQVSDEELPLMRDITTWAMNPEMPIPEFYPDSAVSVPVSIRFTGDGTLEATTAIVKVLTPDRNLYDSVYVPISLYPGEYIQWDWSDESLSEHLGLWVIDYALMDSSGGCIQSYTRGAIFAQKVDVPTGEYYNLGDFEISVNSNTWEVVSGDKVDYEISISNNTDTSFTGKLMVGLYEEINKQRIWKGAVDSITNLTIPQDTILIISFPRTVKYSNYTYFGLYESEQWYYSNFFTNALAVDERWTSVIPHPFSITISLDKNPYLIGYDTVHYTTKVKNKLPYPCSLYAEHYTILDSMKYLLRDDTIKIQASDKIFIIGDFYPIDYDSTIYGKGEMVCDVYYRDSLWNSKAKYFNLIYSDIQCQISLPDYFFYNDSNQYKVILHSEEGYLPSGKLIITSKEYSDSVLINFANTSDTTFTFNYPHEEWYLNDYIKVEYQYGEQKSSLRMNLPFSFPSYSDPAIKVDAYENTFLPGDTALFNGWIEGRGKLIDAPLIGWVVDCSPGGDTIYDTTIVKPDSINYLSFKTYIDTTVQYGEWYSYDFGIKYLDKIYKGTVEEGYRIQPPLAILNPLQKDTFSIDAEIPITYSNPIKTTSKVRLDSIVIYGKYIYYRDIGPGEVSVPPESSYTYQFDIPELTSGYYKLKVFSEVTRGEGVGLGFFKTGGYWRVFLEGTESDFTVDSDRDWFKTTDEITISSLINNKDFAYQGVESLYIYPFEDSANIFPLDLETFYKYGVKLDYDSLGKQIALIDSACSLYATEQYFLYEIQGGSDIICDDFGNIWILCNKYSKHYSNKLFQVYVKKYKSDFSKVLSSFSIPVNWAYDLTVKNGWMYVIDRAQNLIRKLNASSGELMDSWGLRDGTFPNICGISVDDDGSVIVLENDLKKLYKFTTTGCLIDSVNLPSSFEYSDLDFSNGKAYILAEDGILTVRNGVIDTFMISGSTEDYTAISVSKDGKVAIVNRLEAHEVILFSAEGELEVKSTFWIGYDDLTFSGDEILLLDYSVVDRRNKYGFDKGLLIYDNWYLGNYFPPGTMFLDYYPDGEPRGGSFNYKGIVYPKYGSSYQEVSLESMKGSSPYLFDVVVEIEGNWQNSPIFRSLDIEMKSIMKDSTVYSNTHQLDLQAGEEYLAIDTITDSLLPGDYAIFGDIYKDNGQLVNSDVDYFTVIEDEITLIMHHDTNDVPPGWIFHPNIQVINPLPDSEENLHLTVKIEDSLYIDTIFSIGSSEVDTFPVTLSILEPTILYGELILPASDTIKKDIILNVIGGIISLDATAPEFVGLKPFGIISKVVNYSTITQEVIIERGIGDNSFVDTLLVYSNDTLILLDSFNITKDDTLNVTASGIFGEENKELPIGFSINVNTLLESLYYVAPDSVEMTGIISNEGTYPLNLNVLFYLTDTTKGSKESRLLFNDAKLVGKELSFVEFVEKIADSDIDTCISYLILDVGEVDTVSIMFDHHSAGMYNLKGFVFTDTPTVFLDSVSSYVSVVEGSLVSIDSMFVYPQCDSSGLVPLSVLLTNDSYNSFYGGLSISSSFCYFDTVLEISSQSKDTFTILLKEIIDEGGYNFTASLKEGGSVLDEEEWELDFSPIYQIDSLPDEVYVSVGDTGEVYIEFSNIGNSRGVRKVSVDWTDVIGLTIDTTLNPGNSAYLTQNFYIPLDMPGGRYYCNVAILDGAYPEVDTFFPVVIGGVSITAKDSLDRMVYQIGDTADFSILIWNETSWSGSLDAAIQYGDLLQDTSFILGGMEKGILNTSIPRDTLYLDTSGVYMFDPFNTIDYDSIQFNWSASSESLFLYFRTDTVIGGGNWITIDRSLTYSVYEWTQIRIMNESADTEWVDSLVLFYYPEDTIILDTFPLQREIVQFELPVTEEKRRAGWGIYHPTGRSIVLDERYIYTMDDSLTIFTDKARYEVLDTVNITLWRHFPDTNYQFHYWVYFSPTDIIEDSFALKEDTTDFYFFVPEWVASGSYSIDYWVVDKYIKNEKYRELLKRRNPEIKIHPAEEWVEGKEAPVKGDSVILSGSHSFDVNGITVYSKEALMDTNWYLTKDTAKIWLDIFSDMNFDCSLIISSTGTVVDTFTLSLYEDVPNRFEFEYLLTGCYRGMNELYLYLMKDLISLAGEVLYFDVFIPDTIPPMISIVEEPPNTYSSSQLYKVRARIWSLDTNDIEFYDTLYYRLSSVGGAGWQRLLVHSIKGDTHQYLIPSQPNGSHIEFYLNARDGFGNLARYPEIGERGFWILSPMRPTWSELTYNRDTTAILHWNPPKELVSYHCGLNSAFIPLWERTVATRLIPQYQPAVLNRIGVSLIDEDAIFNGTKHTKEEPGFYLDTFVINIYEAIDSHPGTELYSYSFIKILNNYEVFNIPGVHVPEDGLFVGIRASSEVFAILDGFGRGNHTVLYSDNGWSLNTEGEVLIDGFISYVPNEKRSQPTILSFNLLRKFGDMNWTELASGIIDTAFVDTTILDNKEYSYKVEANFSNPVDTFSSSPWGLFIDLTPPILDTVILSSNGDTILISATLMDTSSIRWDSLGYIIGESLIVIPEDSCIGIKHFFSIIFSEDTMHYYLIACDSSLIENYSRYPETGFYHWENTTGVPEFNYPDSTYLANLPQNPVIRGVEVKYGLARRGHVKIVLYDIVGRVAKILADDVQEKGYYSIPLDFDNMSQGVYFLRMRVEEYERTIKLVKLL